VQRDVAHGDECLTVQEAGWSGKENGKLLVLAEVEFDALVRHPSSRDMAKP